MQTLFASLLAVVTMAINAQSWKTTLPDMLFGMIGIFIVIGVIILVTYGAEQSLFQKEEGRQGREIKTKRNPKALGKSGRFFCAKNRVAKCDGLLYNIGKFKRYDEEK